LTLAAFHLRDRQPEFNRKQNFIPFMQIRAKHLQRSARGRFLDAVRL
jgi:hypothetical protein